MPPPKVRKETPRIYSGALPCVEEVVVIEFMDKAWTMQDKDYMDKLVDEFCEHQPIVAYILRAMIDKSKVTTQFALGMYFMWQLMEFQYAKYKRSVQ